MNNQFTTDEHDPRVALYEGCENEPIHMPGSIQPFGALLVADEATGKILQASINIENYTGFSANDLLGRHLDEFLGEEQASLIYGVDLAPSFPNMHEPLLVNIINDKGLNRELIITAHKNSGAIILEFERYETEYLNPVTAYHRLLASLVRLGQAETENELLQQAVVEIQALTQYDRVMYYQFHNDGTGIVTNEALADNSVKSYLEHRFPAADIPARARKLYLKNPLRFIFDIDAEPVPIEPEKNPLDGRSPDLTYTTFRSIAPVHIEYLRNMNVQASLSISIVIEGELVALIACHHRIARTVSIHARAACQNLGVAISSHLARLRSSSRILLENETQHALAEFTREIIKGQRFVTAFRHHAQTFMTLLEADSLFLKFGDEYTSEPRHAGSFTLPLDHEAMQHTIYISDQMGELWGLSDEQREYFTGAIVINLDEKDFLCFGRAEYLKTITWGGEPSKLSTEDAAAMRPLTPRASFESWKETIRGKSKPFSSREHIVAAEIRKILIEARALEFRRIAEQELRYEATTDALTELINRKELYRRGEEEVQRARRYGRELSVIYFDIDHFKAINDTYGHDAGDAVLRFLAAVCRERQRASDICARIGGEEFVFLLPETGLDDAISFAESLRSLFENSVVKHDEGEIRFTSSFGVTLFNADSDSSLENTLKRADKLLYEAKDAGRNRVLAG